MGAAIYYRATAADCASTHGCKLSINRSVFMKNTAGSSGAVSVIADSLSFTVTDTEFSGNTGGQQSALSVLRDVKNSTDSLQLYAKGTTFMHNTGVEAVALYTSGSDVQLSNCTWRKNTGGGGLYVESFSNVGLDRCTFDNNTGTYC